MRRADERHYFGYGVVGTPFPDVHDDGHRFVDLLDYHEFPALVPLQDPFGNYYETGTPAVPQGQSAVRAISDVAYHRILAAAGVALTGVSLLAPSPPLEYAAVSSRWPTDVFREIQSVPPGAGYVPRSQAPPNVYEAAALQERARADHQDVLQRIVAQVHRRGGVCLYNNNVDLLARVGEERVLIEAKSLNDLNDAVDRMRYGMGQLMDYSVRYRSQIQNARPILAFGTRPAPDAGWIADVLEQNNVGFACRIGNEIVALNDRARETHLFAQ